MCVYCIHLCVFRVHGTCGQVSKRLALWYMELTLEVFDEMVMRLSMLLDNDTAQYLMLRNMIPWVANIDLSQQVDYPRWH